MAPPLSPRVPHTGIQRQILGLLVLLAPACMAANGTALKSANPEALSPNGVHTLSVKEATLAMDDDASPELTISLAFPATDCDDFQPHIEEGDVQLAFMCLKPINGAGATEIINHDGKTLPTTQNDEHLRALRQHAGHGGPSWAFLLGGPVAENFAQQVQELAKTQPNAKWPKGTGPSNPGWLQNVRVALTRAATSGAQTFNAIKTQLAAGATVFASTVRVALTAAARAVPIVTSAASTAASSAATSSVLPAMGGAASLTVLSWAIYRMVWSSECRDIWHYIFGPYLNAISLVPVQCVENAQQTFEQLGWSNMLRMEGIALGEFLGIYQVGAAEAFLFKHMPELQIDHGGRYPRAIPKTDDRPHCGITTGVQLTQTGSIGSLLSKIGSLLDHVGWLGAPAMLKVNNKPVASFLAGTDYANTGVDVYSTGNGSNALLQALAAKGNTVKTCPTAHHVIVLTGMPDMRWGIAGMLDGYGYKDVDRGGWLDSIENSTSAKPSTHQLWYIDTDHRP